MDASCWFLALIVCVMGWGCGAAKRMWEYWKLSFQSFKVEYFSDSGFVHYVVNSLSLMLHRTFACHWFAIFYNFMFVWLRPLRMKTNVNGWTNLSIFLSACLRIFLSTYPSIIHLHIYQPTLFKSTSLSGYPSVSLMYLSMCEAFWWQCGYNLLAVVKNMLSAL